MIRLDSMELYDLYEILFLRTQFWECSNSHLREARYAVQKAGRAERLPATRVVYETHLKPKVIKGMFKIQIWAYYAETDQQL